MNTIIKDSIKTQLLDALKKSRNGLTPQQLMPKVLTKKKYYEEFKVALEELQDSNQVELVMRLTK